jgi:hypothetical protein
MTYVQWWCSGVMLRRDFGWRMPIYRGERPGRVLDDIARRQSQGVQNMPQTDCRPCPGTVMGTGFDRVG